MPQAAQKSRSAREEERTSKEEPGVPRFKLAFRRFDFVRIGATDLGSTSGTASGEPFDSVSLDIYPVSSLGGQLAGQQITPFAEAFAGGGYMRRVQFDRTIPTLYWQLGIDAGTEIFVSPHAFISVALGYLHPVNGFAATSTTGTNTSASFMSVCVDTWSFKLGFGI